MTTTAPTSGPETRPSTETGPRSRDASPEAIATEKKVDVKLATTDAKVDTSPIKQEVERKRADAEKNLTQEQLLTKDELEKDLASGMKVSEAVGKRGTKLDTVDKRVSMLPFVGDTVSGSAGLLFFIVQNQKMGKKYRLSRFDKGKAAGLQALDVTFETLVKAPLNTIMAIPLIGWLTIPVLAPVNALVGFVTDGIFKANKMTAKLFKKNFEKMLADAEAWNKANPDKEQIDVNGMKSEIDENMKKITSGLSYKDKVKSATDKLAATTGKAGIIASNVVNTRNTINDLRGKNSTHQTVNTPATEGRETSPTDRGSQPARGPENGSTRE